MKENEIEYQFTAIPTNLMACLDLNCRSMLFALNQLSSYYAKEDGWFFRTNEDLRTESQLSENLVRATLSTLYSIGIIDVRTVGKGKSKTPNKFKLNIERFKDWEEYSLEDCIKHPDLKIETDNYKDKGWQPSYIKQLNNIVSSTTEVPISSPILSQSEDYIENIDNKENNNLSEANQQVGVKPNQFEEYKRQEDNLMDKLYKVSNWTDFKYIRRDIDKLISTASTENIAENTKKRCKKIEKGKIKYFKNRLSKEPYNKYYEDFYREHDCGWFGKVEKHIPQRIIEEEDDNAFLRGMFEINGWDIPESLKPKQPMKEEFGFSPIDDENLPF